VIEDEDDRLSYITGLDHYLCLCLCPTHTHTSSLCGLFLIVIFLTTNGFPDRMWALASGAKPILRTQIAEEKGGDKDQGEAHFPQHHGRSVNYRMLPVP